MEDRADLQNKLDETTKELLRVKARESRRIKEYETEVAKLRKDAAALAMRGRELDAKRKRIASLERENSALKDKIGDLRGQLATREGVCPLDGHPIGECVEIAKVRRFAADLEGYQREALEKTGFAPDNPAIFLCRSASRGGLVDLWREIRQYILERGYAHKAWPFLDSMIDFHSIGGCDLEAYSPDLESPDMDEAKLYWVVPWRENWQYEDKPIDRLLMPGLRDKSGVPLVEPLLALKTY